MVLGTKTLKHDGFTCEYTKNTVHVTTCRQNHFVWTPPPPLSPLSYILQCDVFEKQDDVLGGIKRQTIFFLYNGHGEDHDKKICISYG